MQHPLDYESREKKDPCPFCQSTATVSGDLVSGDAGAVKFVAHDLKMLARTVDRDGVLITQTPRVCSDCGALWSAIDAPELRGVLSRWADKGVA